MTVDFKDFERHWIGRIVCELEKRDDEKIVFSTAKTPSGPIHVGVGRELIYCSVFERILRERGRKTEFLFFVDDFDSLKSFPPNIPKEFSSHKEFLGKPMYMVPCPYNHCESWSFHYAQELIKTFPEFGLHPKIIWSHKLYQTQEMKNLIRLALNRVEDLRKIMVEVVGPTLQQNQLEKFKKEMEEWYPCLVLCENCGKLKPTKVLGWEPKTDSLTYECAECNHKGEVKVKDWPVKLRWRIDWPAKWAIFKVSCEPAGKDHCVKGGAYDTGEQIVSRVFGWKGPYRIPYEWVLLGEKAMKTHKGISFTFSEWLSVAPPEVYRYLILREEPRKHINFAPERLLQLIDEFEKTEKIYFGVEKPSNQLEELTAKIVYPLSIPDKTPEELPVRLPYRFAVIMVQLTPLLGEDKVLGKSLTILKKLYGKEKLKPEEVLAVKERLKMAEYWVENYAPNELKIRLTEKVSGEIKEKLSGKQKEALKIFLEKFEEKDWDEESLQFEVFEIGKSLGIGPKIFEAFYLIFLGKRFGPRLAPFLLSLEKGFVVQRLKEVVE